jgi:hypothetical protein
MPGTTSRTSDRALKNLYEVSRKINEGITSPFLRDGAGRRPVYGGTEKFQTDPHWRDHILWRTKRATLIAPSSHSSTLIAIFKISSIGIMVRVRGAIGIRHASIRQTGV